MTACSRYCSAIALHKHNPGNDTRHGKRGGNSDYYDLLFGNGLFIVGHNIHLDKPEIRLKTSKLYISAVVVIKIRFFAGIVCDLFPVAVFIRVVYVAGIFFTHLMNDGEPYDNAKTQARKELYASFGFVGTEISESSAELAVALLLRADMKFNGVHQSL